MTTNYCNQFGFNEMLANEYAKRQAAIEKRERARRLELARRREIERRRKKQKRKILLITLLVTTSLAIALSICFVKLFSKINEYKMIKNKQQGLYETSYENVADEQYHVETQEEKPILEKGDNVKPLKLSYDEAKERLLDYAGISDDFRIIHDNASDYPDDLIKALANNPELLDYTINYNLADKVATGGITEEELNANIPHFLQWDSRWGYANYGSNCLGLTGCAPTCVSMVVVGLTKNENATPDALANYSLDNGFYSYGDGTYWSFIQAACEHYGVTASEMSLTKENVINELQAGHPIICIVGQGDFTAYGHFIVLVGVSDGKIIVNDPNSVVRSSMLWDYETLAPQILNLWSCH